MAQEHDPHEPVLVNGRYRMVRALGQGATSTVFEVVDEHGAVSRALKLLHPDADEELLQTEFSRLSRLSHDNLARVHDLGRLREELRLEGRTFHAGRLFLVLDLVRGPAPEQVIAGAPASERDRRLRAVARDLANALAHLHGHGLVHHDVKPPNVLIEERGRAILLDLGLSTQQLQGLVGRGTLPYMAPEGLVGGGDHRIDLYGLGATLYHLAKQRPPFAGTGPQLVRQILERPPPPLDLPWLSAEAGRLIELLLSKDPLDRPSSSRSVLAELFRIEGDHGAVARLTSRPELLPPAFVGRQEELDELRRRFDPPGGHVDGDCALMLVAGQPGIGKTRLLSEVIRRYRIAAAGRDEPGLEVVEGPLRRILSSVESSGAVRRWIDNEETGLGPDDLVVLMADALEQSPRARLIYFHDLDDQPLTAKLIEVLLRDQDSGPTGAPLVLVAETHPGSDALARLAPLGKVRSLELAPFSSREAALMARSMLGRPLDAGVLARVVALSRGYPALLAELVRQWHQRGEAGIDLEQIEGLDSLVARQRAWLQGDDRELIDALAVWGEPLSHDDLGRLLEWDPPRVWDALQRQMSLGNVSQEESGAGLPSRAHAKALRRVQRGACRSLHGRAARILMSRAEVDRPRVAGHMLAAGMSGAEEAALEAGRELVAGHATTRAVPLLEQVLGHEQLGQEARPILARLYIDTGRYPEALDLLSGGEGSDGLLRARALQKQGEYAAAEQLLRRLVPTLGAGAGFQEATALLSRLMLQQGRVAEALSTVLPEAEKVLAGSPRRLTQVEAELLEAMGLARIYLGDLERADVPFAWGEQALSGTDNASLLARFCDFRGMVAFSKGALADAEGHFRRALDLARRAGDAHGMATYLANLGSVQLDLGHLGQALEHTSDAIRQLGRLARTTELASALCNLANLLLLLGDLDQARQAIERAGRLSSRLGSQRTEGFLHMLRGDLQRRQAEPLSAVACYEAARAVFRDIEDRRLVVLCELSRSDALVEAGQPGDSHQILRELGREEGLAGEAAVSWSRLAAASSSRLDLPPWMEEELAARCAELEAQGAARELWRAAAALGALLAKTGRMEAARTAFTRARQTWEEMMSRSPDVYHDSMAEDPDARSLAARWQSMLEQSSEGAPEASAPGREIDYDSRWLRRLLSINKRLNSELRLPRLLELIMDTVIELTEAERGFLLLEDDDGTLSIKLARDIDQESLQEQEHSISRSIAEQAARTGEPVVTVDAAEDQRFQRAMSVSDLRLRSVLAVPLLLKGKGVGTIYIDHRLRQGVFGTAEVKLIQDIADQAAIAIDNARLLAENRRKNREIERLNEQLQQKVERQEAELIEVKEELRSSKQALQVRYDYHNIIGQTPKMLELFHLIDRVTDTELPVVIQGESGTGKELVARAIHNNGPRKNNTFVGENCGAIPETLLESVLFGHVRGAFTGAEKDRKGLFEVASGGTLFLDEVGEMSPAMQTKLLRVLQDGELRRVGGTRTIGTDVRVVAASNKDLKQLVERGEFRQDLFYRLNVIRIDIPPLRERREDIPLLVDHFLDKHTPDGSSRRMASDVMTLLMGYPWPGNVRELENEVMRSAALGGEVIYPDDLSPHVRGSVPMAITDAGDLQIKPRVRHMEIDLINRALERTGGNQTQAAKLLGLSRYGLLKKMKRYFEQG